MKKLILTLALGLISTQSWADSNAENVDHSQEVKSALNQILQLQDNEEFKTTLQGTTRWGRACEVEISQSLDQNQKVSDYLIHVRSKTETSQAGALLSFQSPLISVKASSRSGFKNLEVFQKDKSKLKIKMVQRICTGGFPFTACDDMVEQVAITALRDRTIRISVLNSVDSYKALWSSEEVSCDIKQ